MPPKVVSTDCHGVQNYLLEAAQNLTERIVPLTTMLELERAENVACQKQIADLETKLKQTVPLKERVAQLCIQLSEMQKNYEKAASLAEKANRRMVNEQEDNKRFAEVLERQHHALKKKDKELEGNKQALEARDKEVRLQFHHDYQHLRCYIFTQCDRYICGRQSSRCSRSRENGQRFRPRIQMHRCWSNRQ